MGLFDFIKDIGKKPEKEESLEDTLRDAVDKAQLNIHNFRLKLEGDEAKLSGVAATQRDLELARLIVGNFKGVSKVDDDGLQLAPQQPGASAASGGGGTAYRQQMQMVTVRSGDTLSKLAKQYLGNANRYPEIFEANRPMIKDPDEIYPGQVLRIPSDGSAAHLS